MIFVPFRRRRQFHRTVFYFMVSGNKQCLSVGNLFMSWVMEASSHDVLSNVYIEEICISYGHDPTPAGFLGRRKIKSRSIPYCMNIQTSATYDVNIAPNNVKMSPSCPCECIYDVIVEFHNLSLKSPSIMTSQVIKTGIAYAAIMHAEIIFN